jgi:hypothetical protein
MGGVDLSRFGNEPNGLGCDADMARGRTQVKQQPVSIRLGAEHWNPVGYGPGISAQIKFYRNLGTGFITLP